MIDKTARIMKSIAMRSLANPDMFSCPLFFFHSKPKMFLEAHLSQKIHRVDQKLSQNKHNEQRNRLFAQ